MAPLMTKGVSTKQKLMNIEMRRKGKSVARAILNCYKNEDDRCDIEKIDMENGQFTDEDITAWLIAICSICVSSGCFSGDLVDFTYKLNNLAIRHIFKVSNDKRVEEYE